MVKRPDYSLTRSSALINPPSIDPADSAQPSCSQNGVWKVESRSSRVYRSCNASHHDANRSGDTRHRIPTNGPRLQSPRRSTSGKTPDITRCLEETTAVCESMLTPYTVPLYSQIISAIPSVLAEHSLPSQVVTARRCSSSSCSLVPAK